jgi:hypothetical protein
MSETPKHLTAENWKRAGINLGAFLLVFVFIWVIFDNLALALIFALIFAGGGEAVQRAAKSDRKNSDDQTDEDRA